MSNEAQQLRDMARQILTPNSHGKALFEFAADAIEERDELLETNKSIHNLMVSAEQRGVDKAREEQSDILRAIKALGYADGDPASQVDRFKKYSYNEIALLKSLNAAAVRAQEFMSERDKTARDLLSRCPGIRTDETREYWDEVQAFLGREA